MAKHNNFLIEYSKIGPYLYLGSNMCCGFHFKKLARLGIKADIDLEYTHEHYEKPEDVHYFLWLPTRDHYAPTQTQLFIGTKTLDELIKSRVPVYVHCKFGHGRSPTFVIAYFILRGMKVEEALMYVKKKKKGSTPCTTTEKST